MKPSRVKTLVNKPPKVPQTPNNKKRPRDPVEVSIAAILLLEKITHSFLKINAGVLSYATIGRRTDLCMRRGRWRYRCADHSTGILASIQIGAQKCGMLGTRTMHS